MRILERKWVGAGGRIVIAASKFEVVQIPCLQDGKLCKVSIKQNGGTNVAFVADVFDSIVPAGAPAEYDNPYAPVSPTVYRVIPQLNATSGNEASFRSDTGQPFRNADNAKFSDSTYGAYLVIAPTAAGTSTEWDVAVTVVDESGE